MTRTEGKGKRLLVAGQFFLVIGILGFLLNIFLLNNNPLLSFFCGLFFGLALVFNLTFLISIKSE